MSNSRYKAYFAVEGGWFNELPAHWQKLPSNRVFEQRREAAKEDDEQLSATQKYGVVPQSLFMALDDRKVTLALAGTDNFKHVDEGNFVISLRSFEGGIELSNYSGCVSPAYTCLKARKPIANDYYKFALKCSDYILALQSVTQGIRDGKNISYEEFSRLSVPYPPLEEQLAIASFLDHETAKIDALIAEQQRLIELLQEKRQAVISHAVTKGLNSDAPMKDSGVEWLGEVPEHWGLITLGRLCISKCDGPFGSGLKSEHYVEEGVLVVRLQNIKSHGYDDTVSAYIDSDYYETNLGDHDVIPGDLLVVGLGDENNLVGRACVAPSLLGPAMVKADCFRFRLNKERISPAFASFSLNASSRFHGGILSSGSTRSRIPMSMMASREVALPPIEEQLKIEMHIQNQLGRINALQSESVSAVQLLQERRSALISAAVTGQIDVRGLVPEVEAA